MFEALTDRGFQVDFRSHAKAILSVDFPDVAAQLEEVLLASTIPIEEIIGSGGGETKGTQRLRNALSERGWRKHNFVVVARLDDVVGGLPCRLCGKANLHIFHDEGNHLVNVLHSFVGSELHALFAGFAFALTAPVPSIMNRPLPYTSDEESDFALGN